MLCFGCGWGVGVGTGWDGWERGGVIRWFGSFRGRRGTKGVWFLRFDLLILVYFAVYGGIAISLSLFQERINRASRGKYTQRKTSKKRRGENDALRTRRLYLLSFYRGGGIFPICLNVSFCLLFLLFNLL